MDLDQKLPKVDDVVKLEGIEGRGMAGCVRTKLDFCDKCLELEKKCKMAEEKCILLELEIEKKKTEFESLEGGHAVLELEKLAIEDEARLLKKKNEELEDMITDIKTSNVVFAEKGKGVEDVDLTDDVEGEKVLELMIETKVLDCEKKKAESEVEVWKEKCKELELQIIELEKRLSSTDRECTLAVKMKGGLVLPGACMTGISENGFRALATPVVDTPCSNLEHVDGTKRDSLRENAPKYGSRARKQLAFGENRIPSKEMAPVTPVSAGPAASAAVSFIDISDSDDEVDATNNYGYESQRRIKAHDLTDLGGDITPDKKELCSKSNLTRVIDQNDEDDVTWYAGSAYPILKRKRAYTVTSDTESDPDDNIPISCLKTDKVHETHVPPQCKSNSRSASTSKDREGRSVARRHLAALRKCEHEGAKKKSSYGNLKSTGNDHVRGIPTDGTVSNDEAEDEEDSEGESLNGFIVSDPDFSEDDDTSKGGEGSNNNERSASDDFSGDSEDISDNCMGYDSIISRIGRQKDHLVKWEFEADMLAAFGKDPELCMRAVCALYRQQTSDEKLSKATFHLNQRGFSQCDAPRGCRLGEFLTDGDPQGDLKKSVKELHGHDSKGLELCRSLATHYSKQLFAMYENGEDPLWSALGTK